MTAALANLTDCVRKELTDVERLFHQELRSVLPSVNALVKHVSRFRGKMLRPYLVLLAGKACGKLSDAHIVIATVVEMVHMATLVHDDVLAVQRAGVLVDEDPIFVVGGDPDAARPGPGGRPARASVRRA